MSYIARLSTVVDSLVNIATAKPEITALVSRGKFVAYYRVSTVRQGRSGLGLEAQRAAVATYLNGGNWRIVAEFTEVESARKSDRIQLEKALGAARLHRCPLVVSKFDRLTRSVAFLSRLLEANVDVRFADLPQIEGAVQVKRTIEALGEAVSSPVDPGK